MPDTCDLPVLCTRTPPPGQEPADTATSTCEVTHTINTSAVTNFLGHSIYVYKTVRTFTMNSSMLTTFPTCSRSASWTPSGGVSESCVHENSVLYYVNLKQGVCLYKRLSTNINFSASAQSRPVWYMRGSEGGGVRGFDARTGFIPTVSADALEEWILIKDGQASVLSSYHLPGGYHQKAIGLVSPTPDPYFADIDPSLNKDHPILDVGVYNSYQLCRDGQPDPNSRTALDGAEPGDVFFPEWCRDRVIDPQWTQSALELYLFCSGNMNGDQQLSMPRNFRGNLIQSPVPVGDYAKHPKYGELYSFMLSAERTSPNDIVIANSLNTIIPETVIATTLEAAKLDPLMAHTIFYPISLY